VPTLKNNFLSIKILHYLIINDVFVSKVFPIFGETFKPLGVSYTFTDANRFQDEILILDFLTKLKIKVIKLLFTEFFLKILKKNLSSIPTSSGALQSS